MSSNGPTGQDPCMGRLSRNPCFHNREAGGSGARQPESQCPWPAPAAEVWHGLLGGAETFDFQASHTSGQLIHCSQSFGVLSVTLSSPSLMGRVLTKTLPVASNGSSSPAKQGILFAHGIETPRGWGGVC